MATIAMNPMSALKLARQFFSRHPAPRAKGARSASMGHSIDPGTQADVKQALARLISDEPGVVHLFQTAYEERSQLPELDEARGEPGLARVLAGLLQDVPRSRFLDDMASDLDREVDSAFAATLLKAVDRLAELYPRAFVVFRQNAEDEEASVEKYLRALLLSYHSNKTTYPF